VDEHHEGTREKHSREDSGQIAFRVYAGGVAGDELDALRKIRIGQLQSAAFSGVGFGQILPSVRVLDFCLSCSGTQRNRSGSQGRWKGFFLRAVWQKDFELLSWAR